MPAKEKRLHRFEYNSELAEIFHKIGLCYRYLGDENRFRAIAYDSASRAIEGLKDDITVYAKDVKTLDELASIGPSIGEKIIEYIHTGKIETFEKLKQEVPQDLLVLMDVSGFGPATIKLLHDKLGIDTIDDLLIAIEKGKLEGLKGFGPKKIENLLHGLQLYKESGKRMLLWDAIQLGNELLNTIRRIAGIEKAELAGSLRRKKETIGDIDIIITVNQLLSIESIIATIVNLPNIGRVLASGETKISFLLKKTNVQVDVRVVETDSYGAALLYFTGSKAHNIKLRTIAKEKGWKLNEYGLFDAETDKKLAGETEEGIYKLLKMQYIQPELREARGEIELAQKNLLPELVKKQDIRGDLHVHSEWSDGGEKIENLAKNVVNEFPQYEFIVITDHSPSERVAGGLQPEEFLAQFEEIASINRKLGRNFIKKGVEVDVLADDSLDLPDDVLQQFDWVVAAIHSAFTADNTVRLLKACEHPYVNCIAHPSGRLIGKREPYYIDWKVLFDKLIETNTTIEINSQPTRLDLKDDLVKMAIEKGVKLVISTDTHYLNQFDFIDLGVAVARRGWCTKKDILNTSSWKAIELFKLKKQKLLTKAP